MRFPAFVIAVALLAGACGSSGPARGDVLSDLADDAIIGAYQHLETEALRLRSVTTALCAEGSTGALGDTRAALASTRDAWLSTEAMWIGPVMERRSWAVIDWPLSEESIEQLIADETVELDLERLSRRIGANQRGLQAVEYILGPASESPIDALAAPRRCDYLAGIAEVIHVETQLLTADWSTAWEDGPAYRDYFSDVGNGGLDSLINDSVFLLEAMTDAELGQGLGLMGDAADPEAFIEGPAGLGVADLASRTAGLRTVLIGTGESVGLGPLLDDDLEARLDAAFDRAEQAIAEADGSLQSLAVDDPDRLVAVRDALTEIQVIVSTEVVSALGVTIGFSDADGDAG